MKYEYWLDNSGLSNIKKRALLERFQTAEEAYRHGFKEYQAIPGWNQQDTDRVEASKDKGRWERRWEALQKKGIGFLSWGHADYPQRLTCIDNPPFALYYRGRLPKGERSGAIVGARRCSEYGYYMAKKLGEALGKSGVEVISGLAEGIDAAGHKGALCGGGATYGILGNGVDICYPKQNQGLYQEILQTGGVISEFPLGAEPQAYHFPLRNRIISGLSDFVVVVEAKGKSGSLITVDYALEQGKEVYAVPGRTTDALSYGCNNLIRQGAGVILSVEEFLAEQNLGVSQREKSEKNKNLCLEKEEALVYSCLSVQAKSIEEILEETSLGIPAVAGAILHLKALGIVKEKSLAYYIEQ